MLEDTIQLHRAGRLDEAEQGYRDLLAGDPDNPEILHLLGIVRGQRGDLPEAVQLVRRAGELAPDNAACQYTLGEMYLREGALEGAAAAYARARQLNPNLAAAHAGLGQVAYRRGDLAGAEEHFRVALRADEHDVKAITGLANIERLHGDSARALQLFAQASELAPDDPEIQTGYAQAMLGEHMHDFAVRAVDNALTVWPDYALALALRAELHVQEGEFAAALAIFDSLLARGEQVGAAHSGVGDIARLQGRFDAAVAAYDKALELDPNLYPAAIRRADALARGGRTEQAIGDLRQYLAAYPGGASVEVALAKLLARSGRIDEALATWAAAGAHWPGNIDLKAQHALALDRAGRHQEALALAEAAATSPRPALAMLRARGALLAGEPAAAVQRLQHVDPERLARQPPGRAQRYQRLLGLSLDALGRWPDAAGAFAAAHQHAAALPSLARLDAAERADLERLAGAPLLVEARGSVPVLLCGLPGSGVEQVAALLADQAGVFVRRDRFTTVPDFITAPLDAHLLHPLGQVDLTVLARHYQRALRRVVPPSVTLVVDWIPVLDARVLPAARRALPGLRMIVVARDPHDALLDWLAFGGAHGPGLSDPIAGASWWQGARTHLDEAERLLPSLRVDPDALAAGGEAARSRLAAFIGLAGLVPGARARTAATGRGGLPAAFAAGHSSHYGKALAAAFAILDAG